MAWEMQTHTHYLVLPSLAKAAAAEPSPSAWLAERYADQRWDESTGDLGYQRLLGTARGLSFGDLLREVSEAAIEIATVTNGAWEFYVDAGGWHTVPWCSDAEAIAFYG